MRLADHIVPVNVLMKNSRHKFNDFSEKTFYVLHPLGGGRHYLTCCSFQQLSGWMVVFITATWCPFWLGILKLTSLKKRKLVVVHIFKVKQDKKDIETQGVGDDLTGLKQTRCH